MTEVAIGDLRDAGSDEVVKIERDGAIRDSLVDVVVRTDNVVPFRCELALDVGVEPVARSETTNEDDVLVEEGIYQRWSRVRIKYRAYRDRLVCTLALVNHSFDNTADGRLEEHRHVGPSHVDQTREPRKRISPTLVV